MQLEAMLQTSTADATVAPVLVAGVAADVNVPNSDAPMAVQPRGVAQRASEETQDKAVLMIVHLSSLDSFAWHCEAWGEEQCARALGDALTTAIATHPGPIVVTDQEWPDVRSALRQTVLAALRERPPVLVFHHDEDEIAWDAAMRELARALATCGVGRQAVIRLGGVWASHDGTSGCVNGTRDGLSAFGYRHVNIDPTLCGYESD